MIYRWKHYTLAIFVILVLFIAPVTALASDISGADYRGTVIVSNNGTAATNVATTFTLNTQDMIDLGYIDATVSNTAMTSTAGTDLLYMPSVNSTYPWAVFVPSIDANSYLNNYLYTKDATGGLIRYFSGTTGADVSDHVTLELGNDWSMDLTDVYLNTGTAGNLVNKDGAVNIATGSGNVTTQIWGAASFSPTGTNDPSTAWTNDGNIIDGNTVTYAFTTASTYSDTYVPYIEVTLPNQKSISAVRFWCLSNANRTTVDIDTYDGSVWTNRYSAVPNNLAWTTATFATIATHVTKIRFRQYIDGSPAFAPLYEIEYYTGAAISAAVSAGEHDLTVAQDSPFLSMGVDTDQPASGYVEDGLVLYALPYWQGFGGVDDKYTIPTSSNLNMGTGNFSVEAWVNLTDVTNYRYIVSKVENGGAFTGYGLFVEQTTGRVLALAPNGAGTVQTTGVVNDGSWHHVVLSYESGSATGFNVYVDNSNVYQGNAPADDKDNVNDLYIGTAQDGSSYPFNGQIGTVRVWKGTALSLSQVASLYALGSPPAPITPVAENLVLNAPLGQVEESTSPFPTIDSNEWTITATGGATWAVDSGWTLDGTNGLLDVPTNAAFDGVNGITYEVWINPVALNANEYVMQRRDGTDGYYMILDGTGTKVQWKVRKAGVVKTAESDIALSTGEWTHLVGTYDGTNTILYVNGVAQTTKDTVGVGTMNAIAVPLEIGGSSAFGGYINALFGEAKLYDNGITPAQVLQNYNATKSKYTTGDIYTYSTLASVPDNSNDWTLLESAAALYAEGLTVTVGGVLVADWDPLWQYAETWADTVNGIVMTPSFRTASSDANVSGTFSDFVPVEEAKAPGYSLADQTDQISFNSTMSGGFSSSNISGTGFPLAGVISSIAAASDTPEQLPLVIIASIVVLVASLTVSSFLKTHGSGGVFPKVFVIVAFMGIFVALGNFGFDFWMIAVFAIESIAIMFMSKQIGWS